MTKVVLFIVNHSAQLKAPLKLITLLQGEREYSPLVYLNFSGGWNLWKEVEICRASNINFICDEQGEEALKKGIQSGSEATSPYQVAAAKQKNNLKSTVKRVFFFFFSALQQARYMKMKIKELQVTLSINKIDLLVVPEDTYGIHPLFVKAAAKEGIKSIVLPFTKSNHFEIFSSHPVKEVKGISRLYCEFRPKWQFIFKGRSYMPFSLSSVLAYDLAGISPSQPFAIMGGRADRMLLENDDDLRYYSSCGISPLKMVKTGAVYQDVFQAIMTDFASAKETFLNRHNISSTKPVILCTLFPVSTPADAEYGIYNYGTVKNAIAFWLNPLFSCDDFQLWIHHHPRTNLAFVDYIKAWDLKVINEPIESVMPFCDLLVSGISSTTRMALALGKPILCFTEEVHFSDLEVYPGTVTVNKSEEYLALIDELRTNKIFFESLAAKARSNMQAFGPLDGSAYQRILQVFDSATAT